MYNQLYKKLRRVFNLSEENYFTYLESLLREEELTLHIKKATQVIFDCISSKNSIWILGNGGSASTSEHFETDLSFVRYDRKSLKINASALTSNSALITAISNDIGFEKVFSHQLQRKASNGDLCFVISASGNSLNLINGVKVAKQMGLKSIGLLGFDGGELASQVDFSIVVKTEIGKYGPVEDAHLAICHAISQGLLNRLNTVDVT
jgi:D-sedoheptulose 7-phosphate isomerase